MSRKRKYAEESTDTEDEDSVHSQTGDSMDNEDEDSDPPTKTRRTYLKLEDQWAPDGNVVLQLGEIRFKVHSSRLAKESAWFLCLFERSAMSDPATKMSGDWEEIDAIIRNKTYMDTLDVFVLEYEGADAEDLAALLTAMDSEM